MTVKNTHYSHAQNIPELTGIMEAMAAKVATIVERTGRIPVLVYSGMSGTSHATVLAMVLHNIGIAHHMVYVRKEHEKSHGYRVEHNLGDVLDVWFLSDGKPFRYAFIFVDDFTCSGATLHRCVDEFKRQFVIPDTVKIPVHTCLAVKRSLPLRPTMM